MYRTRVIGVVTRVFLSDELFWVGPVSLKVLDDINVSFCL